MKPLGNDDVLIYVKSESFIRWVLPPDAQDEGLRAFRGSGYYTCPVIGNWGGHSAGIDHNAGYFGNRPVRDKEIPEEEAAAIDRAWVALRARGKTIHIIDVGKESPLRRVIEEHRHHLRSFPVLVRHDGRRLEGCPNFSKESLEKFLSD
ncbi:MAG: hypothetical protein WB778_03910 [Thermoplasmata archaeon]|jgi:hypothetical protein